METKCEIHPLSKDRFNVLDGAGTPNQKILASYCQQCAYLALANFLGLKNLMGKLLTPTPPQEVNNGN